MTDWSRWSREELHLLKESGSIDVHKLQQIDELANSVGLHYKPVMLAQWELHAIVKAPSPFQEWYWQLLGFVISSGTGALLFFEGIDADISLYLEILIGFKPGGGLRFLN